MGYNNNNMYISSVTLKNFRNYKTEKVTLSSGINFFVGNNAQGKTNLLEALYLCGVGKSPRTPRDKELIRYNEERASVKVEAKRSYGNDSVEIILSKNQNKTVAINGVAISRMGELMGVVPVVFFSPDEMKIVKNSPSDRRRFMDIAICQMSRPYFYLLSKYNKILAQRNKLLKSGKATSDSLDVWDIQLAKEGARIAKTRRGFISRLNEYAGEAHSFLTKGAEHLRLEYEGIAGDTTEEIYDNFIKNLLAFRERDRGYCFTSVGIQKDDIAIAVDDIDLRTFGSQGQQRTAALSLKLSELELFSGEKEDCPVLLLDDVLSELDQDRQRKLLEKIKDYQTIVTCTHIDQTLKKALDEGTYTVFNVVAGKVGRFNGGI